jgi:uncharacterized OsmC-like protein
VPTLPEYLDDKREKLNTLRDALRNPDLPPAALSATARVAGGSGVRPVHVREFTVVTDSGPALAGYDLGPSAPELLLCALASCLAHTFLIVAANKGLTYDALEVEVRGRLDFRGVLEVGDTALPTPYDITYEARIKSDAAPEQLEHVRREVERLCPVLQAITQPLPVQGQVIQIDNSM